MAAPIEQKAAAAPFATLVAGYLSALLVETVPWLRDNLTPDQKLNLPIIIAFALSAVAAWLAPHTHRPDLAEPETARHGRRRALTAGATGDTNIG
jgi:hypothetical protein